MSAKVMLRPQLIAGAVLGAAAIGAVAAAGVRCLQVSRTRGGTARVATVRGAEGERVRVLAKGGVYQSATNLGDARFAPVFAYIRAFDAMFQAEGPMRARCGHGIERTLMLGGGGYSYPKWALTEHEGISMDVVELDPAVTRLARRWFFLDELEARAGERLALITADARDFLEASDARYDVIVNDLFSGAEPVRALATVEALAAVREHLRPCGLYLANIVSQDEGLDLSFLRDAAATASEVFAYVHVLPCSDEEWGGEDNYLLIACDEPYEFADAVPFDGDFLGKVLRDGDIFGAAGA